MWLLEGEVELLRLPSSASPEPVLAVLRANGIPARVPGAALANMWTIGIDGKGEVGIAVRKEYEEQARELLAAGELHQLEIREDDNADG
jgi:hypothetical protein